MVEEALLGTGTETVDVDGPRHEVVQEPGIGRKAPMRRVCCFAEINWAELRSLQPSPIEFLRRAGVRLFVRVDTQRCIVFTHHALLAPFEGLSGLGFAPHISYLAVDNMALSELAVSRVASRVEFTAGGLEVINGDRSGSPTIGDVTFDRAYVLTKVTKEELETPSVPPGPRPVFRDFAIDMVFHEEDLWLEESDLARIREVDLLSDELVDYPYDHRRQVPAVYEMFQAAYGLNASRALSMEDVADRLERKDAKLFSVKRRALAMKFIGLHVDRSRGRAGKDGAKPFNVADVSEWATPGRTFTFPYVSDGLTIILAVTDWWVDLRSRNPKEHVAALADKLREQNFDEAEVDHLVRLIGGVSLRKAGSKDSSSSGTRAAASSSTKSE